MNRPRSRRILTVLVALVALPLSAQVPPLRPNVLFIAIDDLRPTLGCYGDPIAVSRNIDRLASHGIVFQRAYCQQAVCSPSRLSLLTGRRPDSIRVWDLTTHFREAEPDVVTLPQHLKRHGYHTQSIGKIYHGGGKPAKDPPSWSVAPQHDIVRAAEVRYATTENLRGQGLKRAASESARVPDNSYIDGIVCEAALDALDELRSSKRPFFLAVGFRKPHLPFCAPKRYWDLYERSEIPPVRHAEHPEDAPELATRSWRELEGYSDIPEDGRLSPDKVRELRHGYYACVSYIDALVGRLLDDPGLDWKRAALSQFPRSRTEHRHRRQGDIMGYALRTDRYRYVEWRDQKSKRVLARELYDHESDANETRNLASLSPYAARVAELSKTLSRGWRGALPSTRKRP